jgi:hypothetical protein
MIKMARSPQGQLGREGDGAPGSGRGGEAVARQSSDQRACKPPGAAPAVMSSMSLIRYCSAFLAISSADLARAGPTVASSSPRTKLPAEE